ncbi:MAG: helix-turn-helix domain-containing protein [Anaerolineae bacterium]
MMTETRWINPSMLRWARERLGLSLEDVEEASRPLRRRYYTPVTAEQLARWEAGEEAPALEHLETLAEIYLCPVGWFFLDRPPEERIVLSFRGLKKGPESLSPKTRRALERFRDLARWTVDLLKHLELSWEVRVRPREISPDLSKAEAYAENYRKRLGWTEEKQQELGGDPRGAFSWWRRVLEDLGIFCFELRLNPEEVRGASLWLEGYPFILVNRADTEADTGRLFTLLHEFAHLISSNEGFICDLHTDGHDRNPEPFANRFAAQILLPREVLRRRLQELGITNPRKTWSDTQLDKIRNPFPVSRDVVAIRLEEMGLAPAGFYEEKRQRWQSRQPWGRGGQRPKQEEQKLQEMGHSFAHLLARSASHPGFSWIDVSDVLGMKVERIQEFLRRAEEAEETAPPR